MRALLDRLRQPGGILAAILTLASGTAIAHAITAGTLILLTRIYTPDDFAVLAMFSSIYYVLAVIACMRFDVAIPLPDREEEASDVFWLAVLSGAMLGLVLALALLVTPDAAIKALGLARVAPYMWLLPPTLMTTALFAALQSWHVRQHSFGLVASARVIQSAAASAIQVTTGFTAPSPFGLIAGFAINGGAAAILIVTRMARQGSLAVLRPAFSRLGAAFRHHRFYPLYSTWEALANSAAVQVPILIIGATSSHAEMGQLLLAASVVQAPMSLFGTAIAQVFISRAPERARQGQLRQTVSDTARALFRVGIPLFMAIGLLSPLVFPLLFGASWHRAGIIAAWMSPWLLFQFVASPISMTLYLAGRQRLAMILQFAGLALRCGLTWLGGTLLDGAATEAYAISGILFYGGMIVVLLRLSHASGAQN